MNILELDSYNLDDAVKFNDQLNPRLWDHSEHLRPEVRDQLLRIAQDFREFLGVRDLDLADITVSGSNAAYTYTPNSDIDLHLVVRMPEDAVYRELFDAKKYQYNDQHAITIGGADVELYVQAADQPHVSQGIYSVLNNEWLQVPRRVKSVVDDTSTRDKFEKVGRQIERAIKSGNLSRMDRLVQKIKRMRQTGLEAHGEFGPENLAFKILRGQGLIQDLYTARNQAKDRELSLKEKAPVRPRVTWGFGQPEIVEAQAMPLAEEKPAISNEEILKDFVGFCVAELKIESMPTIKLRRDPQWPVVHKTFGRYINDQDLLEVAWGHRHIMDVLRTVAHELTHRHQHERDGSRMGPDAGETGSPYENEANARAGILMRDYARLHPEYFAVGQAHGLKESWKFKSCTLSSIELSGVLQKYYKTIFEQTGNRWYPHRCSNLARFIIKSQRNLIKENAELAVLFKFQQSLVTIDRRNSVTLEPGKSVAIIQVIPHTADSVIELNGFKVPKKIKNVFSEENGDIRYVEFADGSTYPDQHFITAGKGGGELEGTNTLFFPTQQQAEQAVTMIGYKVPEQWQLSTINIDESQVKESASGYIPTKRQAQDPRFSMALTQDIRPGQLGKEANKLNLKTNKQGVPQVANPNGLFEQLMMEFKQFNEKKLFALAEEELAEVRMAPSNLMQWARSPEAAGVRAGFEAELIFRDTNSGDDSDYEMEPDYDADERCRSIQQIIDFFQGGDYGGLNQRQEARLQEGLDEQYMEWSDEEMYKSWQDERDELIRDAWLKEKPMVERVHDYLVDGMDMDDREADRIQAVGEKEAPRFNTSKEEQAYAETNPDYATYLEALEGADAILNEDVEQTIAKQDGFYDEVLDEFRDGFYVDDDSGFFDDVGLRWMSDVANSYDLDWPYMTGGGGNDGSRDWDSIGDSLHSAVDMPVKVSSNYHSTTRKEGVWIVEPDSSLEPDDREDFGLEIVSPPMPLLTALEKLQEVTDWANSSEGNAYTNGSTGLHMGVSVPFKGGDVDYLKLILFLGDEYVLERFGREANTYCKSAMSKFRENIKGGRSDPMSVIKLMQHGLLELAHKELQKGVGEGKYTSAHIQKGYIEFRSAGGDWLAEENADPEILQNTMLRYARAMSLAANPAEERREYAKKLYKLVAPEGDSQLALFSQFAAGELDKEQLKKQWAEKIIGTEKKMNQRWKLYRNENGVWTTVPGAEWNGYSEDQVKNAVWSKYGREALDSGEYQLVNTSEGQEWEVYDVKTGKTLEIVKGKNKGEAADAVFDKYANQGIGFNVRPYVDPATLSPRAKLAKRIAEPKQKGDWDVIYKPTGRVIDNILRVDREQAEKLLAQVAVLHDFKNADDLEIRPQELTKAADNSEQGEWEFYRTETGNVIDRVNDASRMQANAVRQDIVRRYGHPDASVGMRRVGSVLDVEPDVAQNFAQQLPPQARDPNNVPMWELYDKMTDHTIHSFANLEQTATWAQAQQWLRSMGAEDPDTYQERFAIRPKLANAVAENFADGRGPGRPGDSQRHGIPKGATIAQLEKAAKAPGRKGQLARWQLNMRRGKAKAK